MVTISTEKDLEDLTLCKLRKELLKKEMIEEYLNFVDRPKVLCCKCGRIGNSENNICRPREL